MPLAWQSWRSPRLSSSPRSPFLHTPELSVSCGPWPDHTQGWLMEQVSTIAFDSNPSACGRCIANAFSQTKFMT
eukprot:1627018-Rhodomonas_salina.3